MSEADDTVEIPLVSYHLFLPDDFHEWGPEAKRAWLAGGLTQRQMLNYASDQLGLSIQFESHGTATNRDLAEFVIELTENQRRGYHDD